MHPNAAAPPFLPRRTFLSVLGLGLAAVAVPALSRAAQEPLIVLTNGDLERLRLDFNSNRSKVRLLCILSPTCPQCLQGATQIQTMLRQRNDPNLRVYLLWGLYQGADTEQLARENSRKFAAPNATHFWTARTGISRELAAVLRLGTGRIPFDVYLLYRKGVIWEKQIPAPSYWQQQMGLIQGDRFDIGGLESQIQRLAGK